MIVWSPREVTAEHAEGAGEVWAKRWIDVKAKEANLMANEPKYDAALSLAKEHLTQAFETFRADPRIPWPELHGTVAKAQAQVWVDALKDALEHHRQIEGLIS